MPAAEGIPRGGGQLFRASPGPTTVAGMGVPLTDELLLLGYDDTRGKPVLGTYRLDLALAGAVLLDLTLAGRIDVDGKHVAVRDPAPTDDPVADAALARIAADKPRTPQAWVERLQKGLRDRVLDRLVAQGAVERVEDRVLGFIPRTRYPAGDPRPEADARARLDGAIRHGVRPDARTAALASLVLAAGLTRTVVPDMPERDAKRRLRELTAGDWAGPAVRKAIDAVDAALAVAAMSGVTAAAASG